MQLPPPGRVDHHTQPRPRLHPQQVGGIRADRARRTIRQLHHQMQHPVQALETPSSQQPSKQRMRLSAHPHLARQQRTNLLQSVAITSGTGKSHFVEALAHPAIETDLRVAWFTLESLTATVGKAKVDGTVARSV